MRWLRPWAGYLGWALVFLWGSALRREGEEVRGWESVSILQEFFVSVKKIFRLGGRLATRLSFFEVLRRSANCIYHVN